MAFNEAPLGDGAEAVMRRYEFYRYNTAWGRANGYVDPENGEVMECVVDGCNDPTEDELGDYVGRQIAGFNIEPTPCNNGIDDDGDGASTRPTRAAATPGRRREPACHDGIDNDDDGLVDLDDGGCKGNSANVRENPPRGCGSSDSSPSHCWAASLPGAGGAATDKARRRPCPPGWEGCTRSCAPPGSMAERQASREAAHKASAVANSAPSEMPHRSGPDEGDVEPVSTGAPATLTSPLTSTSSVTKASPTTSRCCFTG